MMQSKFLMGLAALATAGIVTMIGCAQQPMQSSGGPPRYQIDPLWMKQMPDNWIFGQV